MHYKNYLNSDFKNGSSRSPGGKAQRRHLHLLAAVSIVLGGISFFGFNTTAEATRFPRQSAPQPFSEALNLPQEGEPQKSLQSQLASHDWRKVTVRKGDTLSQIFEREGLGLSQLYRLLAQGEQAEILKRLHPGDELELATEGDRLKALRYNLAPHIALLVEQQDNGFHAQLQKKPLETRLNYASVIIDDSLYQAGQRANLSDNLIMELAGVFGWDIDFALDIRSGDSFTLLYEEQYLDGEKLRDGNILAAEFTNNGKVFRAIRFTDAEGDSQYYTPEGLSMRKAFLRAPVDFRRISSRFQRERYHPVLGKKRPHRGVDYAAATGTPIKAAGDGKVIFVGKKGGYGRTVIIQHGSKYTTLYAHMNGYKHGIRSGNRVKQGQVIGYVGKSGLATGPHLHYEFRVNGVHRNPLTVKLPDAAPIAKKYRETFEHRAAPLLARLELVKQSQLALANR